MKKKCRCDGWNTFVTVTWGIFKNLLHFNKYNKEIKEFFSCAAALWHLLFMSFIYFVFFFLSSVLLILLHFPHGDIRSYQHNFAVYFCAMTI